MAICQRTVKSWPARQSIAVRMNFPPMVIESYMRHVDKSAVKVTAVEVRVGVDLGDRDVNVAGEFGGRTLEKDLNVVFQRKSRTLDFLDDEGTPRTGRRGAVD